MDAASLVREQKRQLAAKVASRRRTAPRRKPGEDAKAAARGERLRRLAEIRAALHMETGGICVICGLPLMFVTMHAHHMKGGEERRLDERVETMAPVHGKCHDIVHGKDGADPLPALRLLLAWCRDTFRLDAASALEKRIAKVNEARRPTEEARR
jgi:hypothetical protein